MVFDSLSVQVSLVDEKLGMGMELGVPLGAPRRSEHEAPAGPLLPSVAAGRVGPWRCRAVVVPPEGSAYAGVNGGKGVLMELVFGECSQSACSLSCETPQGSSTRSRRHGCHNFRLSFLLC